MDSLISLFNLIVSFFVQLVVAIIGFFIVLARSRFFNLIRSSYQS